MATQEKATPITTLELAQTRWWAHCIGIMKTAPRFRVAGEEVKSLEVLEPSSERFYGHYNTIEKLFEVMLRSLMEGQFNSTVKYDPELGYPISADLDPRQNVADDELRLRVSDFRVLGSTRARAS